MEENTKDTLSHVVEEEQALESILEKLHGIKGYMASGVMTYTGGMLASHSKDPDIDLNAMGMTFNEIFRAAHETSEKIGMQSCQETTIKTPKGIVVMRCPGVNAMVHFHVIVILSDQGNYALAKMEIENMVPKILKFLLRQ